MLDFVELVERMMHCTIVLFFQLKKKVKFTNQASKRGASHLFNGFLSSVLIILGLMIYTLKGNLEFPSSIN